MGKSISIGIEYLFWVSGKSIWYFFSSWITDTFLNFRAQNFFLAWRHFPVRHNKPLRRRSKNRRDAMSAVRKRFGHCHSSVDSWCLWIGIFTWHLWPMNNRLFLHFNLKSIQESIWYRILFKSIRYFNVSNTFLSKVSVSVSNTILPDYSVSVSNTLKKYRSLLWSWESTFFDGT